MVNEKKAIIKTPYENCICCEYFQGRKILERGDNGLELICDLEPMCRNAVHIAWDSLTEEEQKARIEKEKAIYEWMEKQNTEITDP